MEPYYQDDSCTIYCADCRDVLPELPKVDLVLTDPPYGMEFQSNYRRVRHEKIHGDDNLPLDIIHECINISSCACYVFCRWDNLPDMPKPKSVLAWIKNNWSMGDLKHEHGRQWEACCFYPGPLHSFRKRIPDVIQRKRTGNVLHPTEKPLYLMTALIDANEGDLILDPFMGSGTTLRAAKDLGRKAIGIEISEEYCRIAVNRLRQEVLSL
jgi:site-specific DNA-methyltransferase (adenine-specific)